MGFQMIVFCLDSLADDSHRRRFITQPWPPKCTCELYGPSNCMQQEYIDKYGYEAYNAACDRDHLIDQTALVFRKLHYSSYEIGGSDIQIWTDRCESTKVKTVKWLDGKELFYDSLKMRPMGDDSPKEVLFEKWLDEHYYSGDGKCMLRWADHSQCCKKDSIEMVFSSHKPTIDMFRRRGVFVFDCNQGEIMMDALIEKALKDSRE